MSTPLNLSSNPLTAAQLMAVWIMAGGNPIHAQQAAAVALAESSGHISGPLATGYNQGGSAPGSTDVGLWQINNFYHPAYATYDPIKNAKGAIIISHNGTDWTPWCSAWSNNDCTGVFWGAGSNALRHYQTIVGQNIQPASGYTLTSLVQPGDNSTTDSSGNPQSTTSLGDTCAWRVNFPLVGNTCFIGKTQLRAGLGGLMMFSSVVLGIVGIAIIAVFSFNKVVGGPVGQAVGVAGKVLGKTGV